MCCLEVLDRDGQQSDDEGVDNTEDGAVFAEYSDFCTICAFQPSSTHCHWQISLAAIVAIQLGAGMSDRLSSDAIHAWPSHSSDPFIIWLDALRLLRYGVEETLLRVQQHAARFGEFLYMELQTEHESLRLWSMINVALLLVLSFIVLLLIISWHRYHHEIDVHSVLLRNKQASTLRKRTSAHNLNPAPQQQQEQQQQRPRPLAIVRSSNSTSQSSFGGRRSNHEAAADDEALTPIMSAVVADPFTISQAGRRLKP